ncbi:MAG: acyl-CoA dehydratase activase [Desulfomonilaceae bacterium]|nr:acyl-CoA dehydratase activase [Desulfomonilaceae bacterium]
MIVAGCDVGSLSGEAVILKDNSILTYEIMRVRPRPEQTAQDVMIKALSKADLTLADLDYCVSTGYGREKIPFAHSSISEISCHGRGAHWANTEVRTVIDIGGQDCKVIRVDKRGYMVDFAMNDKCAAGTGRFLEGMAKALGVSLSEMGPLSFESSSPIGITKTCSVLAQYDVVCMINDGMEVADIAAGINKAMAERISKMTKKVGVRKEVAMTGGVAKNSGVVHGLKKVLDVDIVDLNGVDPQIVGALGAALFAQERAERELRK